MSDGKVVEFRLVEGEQLASVIFDLAATGSIGTTRRRFKARFEKGISEKHIRLIQQKYANQIKRKREELNSPESLKDFAALTKRAWAELLYEIAESAMEPELVGIAKFKEKDDKGEEVEVSKPIYKVDRNSALVALRQLKDLIVDFEDLAIKKSKVKPHEADEDEEAEVDDGVA